MLETVLQYIQSHENILLWSLIISGFTFVGTLIIVPALVIRIPADYFTHERRTQTSWAEHHPVVRLLILVSKNLLGYVIIVMGIAMLVLPGQGLLTIIIGLMLINFPGKYRLERWLISLKPVYKSINWLRLRAGHEPLLVKEKKE